MFGAKLSWCQIVRCQIVLVPNCPGAKLSTFIILVPNCPLLLSWCQIVRFIILVPNCPVPNCPVPNCPVPNCPTTVFVVGAVVCVGVVVGVDVGIGAVFISQSCTNCEQSKLRPGKEMQVTASANRYKQKIK